MSQNIYCKPVLKINDVEIQHLDSVRFSDTGNNQLQKLSATITEPDLENFTLFNAKVEFYLNYGSSDGCPIFRGFVKDFNPSGKNVVINALDVRTLLSSLSHISPVRSPIKLNAGLLTNSNFMDWGILELLSDNLILLPAINVRSSWPVGSIDVINPISPPSDTVYNFLQWLPNPIITPFDPEGLTVSTSSFLNVNDVILSYDILLSDAFMEPTTVTVSILSNCDCIDEVTPLTKFNSDIDDKRFVVPSLIVL